MDRKQCFNRVFETREMWILVLRRILFLPTFLLLCNADPVMCQSNQSVLKKLIVEDGRYEESDWARQLSVTHDDRHLISSDTKHGVRIYDLKNGDLINSMEGHSLDGDSYYDAQADIFVTTGDRTIKIWDVPRQKLLKKIQQSFHSQFMQNVYIDTKRQFVFAQGIKYSYATGKVVKVYEETGIDLLAECYFFQDRYYLFDDTKGQIRAYDCFTDKLLKTYTLDKYRRGTDLYFDNRSGRLFIGYTNGVWIIDIATGRSDFAVFNRTGAYSNVGQHSCYTISADGNFLVAGSNQGVGLVVVRKNISGAAFLGNTREVLRQNFNVGEVQALNTSNKVLYTMGGAIHLLDLDSMRPLWSTEWKTVGLRNIHLAPDGTQLYINFGSEQKVNRHWFERTFSYRFDKYFDSIDAHWGTFKPILQEVDLPKELLQWWRERSQTARIHLVGDLALAPVPAKLPFALTGTSASPYDPVEGVVASPTGRYALTSKDFGNGVIYDRERPIGRTPDLGVIYHVEYSPDERYMALGGSNRWVAVFDLSTGKMTRKVYAESYVTSITFSSDNEYMFTGSLKNEIMMWRLSDGKPVRKFIGSNGSIIDTEIFPDGRHLISIAEDGALRFWDVQTGDMLLAVFFMNPFSGEAYAGNRSQRPWVVVTPDGRFDTNNLEEIKGLHWIMPDDPLHALPLEIFMRNYYEPRLLPRVLAGEKFEDLPRLDQLNRAQPKIEIKEVRIEDEQAGLVAVTVEVASDQIEISRDGKTVVMQSGAFDLRLFRNGQLVAQLPEPKEEATPGEQSREQELNQWRRLHQIQLDPQTGKKTVTFHGIRLPRKAGLKQVDLSAYAFNVDRVKSTTSRTKLDMPKALNPRQGRAYIVTIGVNVFEGNAMNRLNYAANDAKTLGAELSKCLKTVKDPETGQLLYGEAHVVPITLVTEFGTGDQAGQLDSNYATKDRIKAVIDKLAGQPVEAARLVGIANADQLQLARPEDLVLIAFSTHGDTDQRGQFYLMPYDLGASAEAAGIRQHAISNEELSAWLRTLDAGELVMIVDACHSAATVENKEFKPGPMGSRGLGQLAFDKGMRILAASQRDQYALETEKTQQGLLSYALVREGLKDNAADFKPKDTRILLSEWLSYGAERVPGLYQDYRDGKLKARTATPLDEPEAKNFISIQQPALFDFARGRDALLSDTRGKP